MDAKQRNLFDVGPRAPGATPVENLWPRDFALERDFLSPAEAHDALAELSTDTPWEQDEIMMYGKLVRVPRLTAWFGDRGADYEYSGVRNVPHPWTQLLAELRDRVREHCNVPFNSVLLNLYRDGSDSVAWHRDDEPELGDTPTIASLSLGASRRFRLRSKDMQGSLSWDLPSGSLLVMSGTSQRDWEHCVSKTKRPVGPRINLTFRVVSGPTLP